MILKTDLYQLSMVLGYIEMGTFQTPVTCEAFFRKLPSKRNLLVLTGIQRAINSIYSMRFTDEEIAFLKSLPNFSTISNQSFETLKNWKFTGEILAAPEGSIVFPNVPFLQVNAEVWQAQLIETILLSIINHSTVVSSKAARIVKAAGNIPVIELGTRRTHDEAAIDGARAAYISGISGTSNVEAGFRYNIPVYGTMAHMWVMFHNREEDSYKNYMSIYKNGTSILVDTYGIRDGIEKACEMAKDNPNALSSIRIDSELFDKDKPTGICHLARTILNKNNFQHTKITVSDDLNEYKIQKLLEANEPIDTFGIGTELIESKDAPTLSGVYKIVEVNGNPVSKKSSGKISLPGKHIVGRKCLYLNTKTFIDMIRLSKENLSMNETNLLLDSRYILEETINTIRDRAITNLSSLKYNQVLGNDFVGNVICSNKLYQLMER